jgi:DNA primase
MLITVDFITLRALTPGFNFGATALNTFWAASGSFSAHILTSLIPASDWDTKTVVAKKLASNVFFIEILSMN